MWALDSGNIYTQVTQRDAKHDIFDYLYFCTEIAIAEISDYFSVSQKINYNEYFKKLYK